MDPQSPNSSQDFSFFRSWLNLKGEIQRYWALYGGWSALIRSPYFHVSVLLSILLNACPSANFDPASETLSILPNVLGFTVGALAIILALSSSEFFAYMIDNGKDDSLFMMTIASFVHFIIVQIIAIMGGLVGSAYPSVFMRFLNTLLLLYAILTTLAIVIQLFQMATLFNASRKLKAPSNNA
jgi:hypothetical protein